MVVCGIALPVLRLAWSCRHVDSAQAYRNEADVGFAVTESGLKREDVFISRFSFLS